MCYLRLPQCPSATNFGGEEEEEEIKNLTLKRCSLCFEKVKYVVFICS
jgi:hypothetical protein